jgi:hypothetical protein
LFLTLLILASCSESQRQFREQIPNVDSLAAFAAKADTLIFINRVFADTGKAGEYIINAQYPELAHYERENIRRLYNTQVKEMLESSVASFRTFIGGSWNNNSDATEDTPNDTIAELKIDYSIVHNSRLIISVVFHFEQFELITRKRLHYNRVLNFNLIRGETMSIEDLIAADTSLLNRLSDIAFHKLKDMPDADTVWIRNGTEPILENFHNFIFMPDSGSVIFDVFQVAPSDVGSVYLKFAWKELFPDSLQINPLNAKP